MAKPVRLFKLAVVGLIALCMPRSTARPLPRAGHMMQANNNPPASTQKDTLSGQ